MTYAERNSSVWRRNIEWVRDWTNRARVGGAPKSEVDKNRMADELTAADAVNALRVIRRDRWKKDLEVTAALDAARDAADRAMLLMMRSPAYRPEEGDRG